MASLAILLIPMIVGCETVRNDDPLPCPPRPLIDGLTIEQQQLMGGEIVKIVDRNQSALIEYAERLEVRLGCT